MRWDQPRDRRELSVLQPGGRAAFVKALEDFIYAGIHGAEDYGTITTYLRAQGLVPPSTALVSK